MLYMKRTEYQQPSSHSNAFTEFILTGCEAKNLKISQFGMSSYTANGGGNRYFPYLAGGSCIIDTITAYNYEDGSIIDQLRNVPSFIAYRTLMNRPDYLYSSAATQLQGALNYDLMNDVAPTNPPTAFQLTRGSDQPSIVSGNALITLDLGDLIHYFLGLDQDSYTQYRAALKDRNHRRVKQIKQASNGVRCDLVPIRIRIMYSTKPANMLFVGGNQADTYVINPPVLVYDRLDVTDPSKNMTVVYDRYEQDVFSTSIDAAKGLGSKLTDDKALYGAVGKLCTELVLINAPQSQDVSNQTSLSFSSTGLWNENIQMIVNGLPIIPANKLDTPARKQLYLNYSKPNFTTPLLGSLYWHQADILGNGLFGNVGNTTAWYLQRSYSYLALDIGARINTLRLIRSYDKFQTNAISTPSQLGQLNTTIYYRNRYILSHKDGETLIVSA